MAIDLGRKKIGVAISDSTNKLAYPLEVLESEGPEIDATRLSEIIDKNDIDSIVIGLPMTLKGEKGSQAIEVADYADKLAKFLHVDVKFRDERFTSKEARRRLRESGKKVTSAEDAAAAAIILQDYLDSRRN